MLSVQNKDVYICKKGHKALQPEATEGQREINLMLISEGDRWHYTPIKSLSRLPASKNSKHAHKQYFCNNCLQGYTLELSRDQHYSYCIDNEMVRAEMPSKGSTVEFYDGQNQFKVPFMMYADFESILMPMLGPSPDLEKSLHHKSEPAYSFWLVHLQQLCLWNVKDPLTIYRGEDCIETFCNHIRQEAKRLYHMFSENLWSFN